MFKIITYCRILLQVILQQYTYYKTHFDVLLNENSSINKLLFKMITENINSMSLK